MLVTLAGDDPDAVAPVGQAAPERYRGLQVTARPGSEDHDCTAHAGPRGVSVGDMPTVRVVLVSFFTDSHRSCRRIYSSRHEIRLRRTQPDHEEPRRSAAEGVSSYGLWAGGG